MIKCKPQIKSETLRNNGCGQHYHNSGLAYKAHHSIQAELTMKQQEQVTSFRYLMK